MCNLALLILGVTDALWSDCQGIWALFHLRDVILSWWVCSVLLMVMFWPTVAYWKMTCFSSAAGVNNSCYFYENIPVVQIFVPLLVIFKRYPFIIFSLLLCHLLSWWTVVFEGQAFVVGHLDHDPSTLSLSQEFLDWGRTHRRPSLLAAIFLHVVKAFNMSICWAGKRTTIETSNDFCIVECKPLLKSQTNVLLCKEHWEA